MKCDARKIGFTLVELIVVIAIIGITAAIAAPNVIGYFNSSKSQSLSGNARTIFLAAQNYLTDAKGSGTLASLVYDGEVDILNDIMPAVSTDSDEYKYNEGSIVYVKIDKRTDTNADFRKLTPLYSMLSSYVKNPDILDNSILIEYNKETGEVRSVFYSEIAPQLSYTSPEITENVKNREEGNLKEKQQGYYGVEFTGVPQTVMQSDIYVKTELINSNFTPSGYDVLALDIFIDRDDFESDDFDYLYDIELQSIDGTAYPAAGLTDINPKDAALARSIDAALTASTQHTLYLDKFRGDGYYRLVLVLDAIDFQNGKTNMNLKNSIAVKYPQITAGDYIRAVVTAKSVAKNGEASASTDYENAYFGTTEGGDIQSKKQQLTDNAYQIKTTRQLSNIRYDADGNFTQINDIYCSNWRSGTNQMILAPINAFSGAYTAKKSDTENYKISGLQVRAASGAVGLFSRVLGSVSDIDFIDPSITANSSKAYNGVVAGINSGAITNCNITSSDNNAYKITTASNTAYTGSIAGKNEAPAIDAEHALVTKTGGEGSAYWLRADSEIVFYTNASDAGVCPHNYVDENGGFYIKFSEIPDTDRVFFIDCPQHSRHRLRYDRDNSTNNYNIKAGDVEEGVYMLFTMDKSNKNANIFYAEGGDIAQAQIDEYNASGAVPTITKCTSGLTLSGGKYVGGIVGDNCGGVVSECRYTGSISSGADGNALGGIAGRNAGEISKCYSGTFPDITSATERGSAIASATANTSVIKSETKNNQASAAGGIAGENYYIESKTCAVTQCVNIAQVTYSNQGACTVGGIVGSGADKTLIESCYNSGSVSAGGRQSIIGGVIGANGGAVKTSYNTGRVNIASISTDNGVKTPSYVHARDAYIGGAAGYNGTTGTLLDCYNINYVGESDGGSEGGIIGFNEAADEGAVTNCCFFVGKDAVSAPVGSSQAVMYGAKPMYSFDLLAQSMTTAGGWTVTQPSQSQYFYPYPYIAANMPITPTEDVTIEEQNPFTDVSIINAGNLMLSFTADSADIYMADITVYDSNNTAVTMLEGIKLKDLESGSAASPVAVGSYRGYYEGGKYYIIADDLNGGLAKDIGGSGNIYFTVGAYGAGAGANPESALYGSGTQKGTINISNVRHLNNLRYIGNVSEALKSDGGTVNVYQTENIDCGGVSIAPISSSVIESGIHYDGQAHYIANLTIAPKAGDTFKGGIGLFTKWGGGLYNLGIVETTVVSNARATEQDAVVAGVFAGTNLGTISDCYTADSRINVTSGAGDETVFVTGGIAGINTNSILNCYGSASIIYDGSFAAGSTGYAGLICGSNRDGALVSWTYGLAGVSSASGNLPETLVAGNLVGKNAGRLENSVWEDAFASVTGENTATGSVTNVNDPAYSLGDMGTAAPLAYLNAGQTPERWAINGGAAYIYPQLMQNPHYY